MTLAQLLSQYILPHNLRALPVVQDGQLVGLITLGDIKDVPQDQWGITTVGQVMTPRNKLQVVHPQDDLSRAMEMLGSGHFDQVPVIDMMGRLVGVLNRAHVLSWLQIRDTLKLPTPAPPGP
jgi:CBS domain-containing protein